MNVAAETSALLRDHVEELLTALFRTRNVAPAGTKVHAKQVMMFQTSFGLMTVWYRWRDSYEHDCFTLRQDHRHPVHRELDQIRQGAFQFMFYFERLGMQIGRWQLIDLRPICETLHREPDRLPPLRWNPDDTSYRKFRHEVFSSAVAKTSDHYRSSRYAGLPLSA